MIQELDLSSNQILDLLHHLQLEAYELEAKLIGSRMLPPLLETKENLSSSNESFFGIRENEKIIAAISYSLRVENIEICKLMVSPLKQRNGLGKKLVKFLLSKFNAGKSFKVSTGAKNTPARKLYEDLGFKHVNDENTPEGIKVSHYILLT